MVLGWLRRESEPMGVEELIARKKYERAVDLLRLEFQGGRRDARLRLQLADVLVMAGRGKEAVPILLGLADEFAREGFAAKAISVLKKVQRIEPGRADVEARLASALKDKQQTGAFSLMPVGASAPGAAREPRGLPLEFGAEEVGGDEIGFEALAPSAGTEAAPAADPPEARADEPPNAAAAAAPAAAEDDSLGDVLVALIEDVLVQQAAPSAGAAPAAAAERPVVASPLFDDFTEDELADVIRGLQLRSYEPGDIVVMAGDAGNSLFVVASGTAKAFVRSDGGPVLAREMEEGDFFGEISMLAGGARTATVTAKTRCELLELDRATLDGIAERRPHVREVMKQFCEARLKSDQARRAPA